jgi:hypothetical protein
MFARYPHWYAPLERYISYGVDQAERVVEGIRGLERWMDDFATVHNSTPKYASTTSILKPFEKKFLKK